MQTLIMMTVIVKCYVGFLFGEYLNSAAPPSSIQKKPKKTLRYDVHVCNFKL